MLGSAESGAEPLTLDDWAVALRARAAVPAADPGVSIDPVPCQQGIPRTPPAGCPEPHKQKVVFFAGIGDTRFGKVCFDADWLLKKLAVQLEKSGTGKLRSFLELLKVDPPAAPTAPETVGARFWFYPVASRVVVTRGAVLLEPIQMGVFSELLSQSTKTTAESQSAAALTSWFESASKQWAVDLSENYEELARTWPVLNTLRGLTRLAALAKGLYQVKETGDLDYWMREYAVQRVATPTLLDVVKVEAPRPLGTLEGGVQLMAMAMRAQEGDLDSLRKLAVNLRPEPASLSWKFQLEIHNGRIEQLRIPQPANGAVDVGQIALLYAHAAFLKHQGRLQDAIAVYDTVTRMLPRWEGAYNDRGLLYQELHDLARALADFNRALDLNPKTPIVLNNRGNNYDLAGERKRALADYGRALDIDPAYANAHLNRAKTYFDMGNMTAALRDLDLTIELQPTMGDAFYTRGRVYDQMGRSDEALRDYSAAIAQDPSHKQAYSNRGMLLAQQGKYASAFPDFDRALQIDPHDAIAHSGRGIVYFGQEQYEKAVQAFNAAIREDPANADFVENRAAAYGKLKQNWLAERDFKRALEIDPRRPNALRGLCIIYSDDKIDSLALPACQKAVQLDKTFTSGYMRIREILAEKGFRNDKAGGETRSGKGKAGAEQTTSGEVEKPRNPEGERARPACPKGMVLVPGGTFWMGSSAGEGDKDEQPRHPVKLSGFCIDQTEVTVAEYRKCVGTGSCVPAPTTVNLSGSSAEDAAFLSRFCNAGRAEHENHPNQLRGLGQRE